MIEIYASLYNKIKTLCKQWFYEKNEIDTSLGAKQDVSNLVTSWSNTLSHTKYPSEKLVKEYIDEQLGDIDEWLTR